MVCAGHEDPLLLSADGKVTRVRLEGGPPFCVAEFPYPLETLTLKPGETLVLVTDGVTEAQNAKASCSAATGSWRQDDRKPAARPRSARRSAIGSGASRKATEATDDLTVMAMRYLGTA